MPAETQLSCFLIKFCFDSLCLLGFYYYFQFHFLFFWDFELALYARSWNLNEFFISLSALAFCGFLFCFCETTACSRVVYKRFTTYMYIICCYSISVFIGWLILKVVHPHCVPGMIE